MLDMPLNQKKEPAHVLDIYLFIDPIDTSCHQCATEILDFLNTLNMKVYTHFIPYFNLKTIDEYIKKYQLPTTDLTLRNKIYETDYLIGLTYKAATFQGKRKARQFLAQLKVLTDTYRHNLTDEDILGIAELSNLDLSMLLEDRQSENAKYLYQKDLEIAHKFSISKVPSIIVFDSCRPNGILIEEDITVSHIQHVIETSMDCLKAK
ncbi:hypothetical protein GMA11_00645 [Granulicatella sp. zg-ZJ]|uniref:DsbA family protein n=1 Tax=unclassified Granulicatella TaxID=2630493 RepID=UPI0013C265C4|nr:MULTISPECIES: DsbA family protein [unclassified Granulicatella]MBS4750717.1 DsbA family protein [Carnobacteriaceae bacterium zg-ZUI78]NEW61890.1 hypothetical protein [Granulicatella sp. zg-ZJ]NEW65964.1 hypothetical protein [Granulicatella sp. zg-84]QMI85187.1 DsbA family protein [Carnobacteriaceae bacterium zg-84]